MSKMDVLRIYRTLLKAANQFPNYNFSLRISRLRSSAPPKRSHPPMSNARKLGGFAVVVAAGTATFYAALALRGNDRFYSEILMPLMRCFDPETAHHLAILMASWGIVPRFATDYQSKRLNTRVFDIDFENPIGLAAGFDKDAEALGGLFRMGFGFVEVGSVTPLPQPGNEKPRLFRLIEDDAVINRYGFNSEGAVTVAKHVQQFRDDLVALRKMGLTNELKSPVEDGRYVLHVNFYSPDVLLSSPPSLLTGPPHDRCVVAVNLGKNKLSTDAIADYTTGLDHFADKADFIVINLSSPNTPGLRALQSEHQLEQLLKGIDDYLSAKKLVSKPKILVKLAPDLSEKELDAVAKVALKWSPRLVSGLVMGNTSTGRPETLKSAPELRSQAGGLSGKPIKKLSTQQIACLYKLTNGRLPIIGVGGVATGKDAYEKITAGASLVEVLTALVFDGPPVVTRVKRELDQELQRNGFKSVAEAVGIKANEFAFSK